MLGDEPEALLRTEPFHRPTGHTALRRIAFLLEWRGASPYPMRAFHTAADAIRDLPPGLVDAAQACELGGVGPVTAEVIAQASTGTVPRYLARLQAEAGPAVRAGWVLAAASTGDLRSDWSDGGSPLEDMADAADALGHQWGLASAAAHPGGGLPGAPGANTARAALRAHGLRTLHHRAPRV